MLELLGIAVVPVSMTIDHDRYLAPFVLQETERLAVVLVKGPLGRLEYADRTCPREDYRPGDREVAAITLRLVADGPWAAHVRLEASDCR